ncbi:MAG: chorismate mutase [Phycisphaerae bacterium]|nr:chorismate mutase [Gemmatimonadaceae bacterium]
MTANTLNQLRAAIGDVDSAIITLIAERTALACAIGLVKAEDGQPVTDPARESAVVANAARLAREAGLPAEEIRTLYWQLMAIARQAQLQQHHSP